MINYNPKEILEIANLKIHLPTILFIILFYIYLNLVTKEFYEKKILKKNYLLFYIITFIPAFIGGRIWYALLGNTGWKNWYDFFNPNIGGWTSWGVLLGGILGIYISKKILAKNKSLLKIFDSYAYYLPIWIAIYRVGCTIKGCCYGKETLVPWAFHYVNLGISRHPTQIYSIINALIIFGILYLIQKYKRKSLFDGQISLILLLTYTFGRFIIDIFRYYPKEQYKTIFSLSLTISQWTGLTIFITSLIAYIYNIKHKKKIKPKTKPKIKNHTT